MDTFKPLSRNGLIFHNLTLALVGYLAIPGMAWYAFATQNPGGVSKALLVAMVFGAAYLATSSVRRAFQLWRSLAR